MSEQLKQKMLNYEVVPPVTIWSSITQELNEEQSVTQVAERIYQFEVTPPESSLPAIFAALKEPLSLNQSKLKKTGYLKPLRWLSAAAIMGLLLTGSYFLLYNQAPDKNITADQNNLPNPDQLRQQPPSEYDLPQPDKILAVTSEEPAKRTNYRPKRHQLYSSYASYSYRPLLSAEVEESELISYEEPIYIEPRPILNEYGEVIQDMGVVNPSNNKYINITAPNGQQTKISSKLANAMLYFSTDDQNGGIWSETIKEWRNKIMQSSFVPSSNNFLDILELSELIGE